MEIRKLSLAAALMTGGLVVGYMFGPAVGNAVTSAVSNVHIQDNDSGTNASVTSDHKVSVDTEAGRTKLGDGSYYLDTYGLQYTLPNGQDVLANGTSGCSKSISNATVIASANVNLATPSSGITTVTLKDKTTSAIVWQTSFDNLQMGGRDVSFDGGVWLAGGYTVSATGSTGSLVCQVIGQDYGVLGHASSRATAPRG